ncbi:MAG: hypothetical protein Q8T11_14680 [Elusimicrobiota bacterium]|nr:hypothetical protein [Elusimicrobiota bacterium]
MQIPGSQHDDMGPTSQSLKSAAERLFLSTYGSSRKTCLANWSRLIRARDANRCVLCEGRTKLSAHHICRKSFLPQAQFQTGNGITLCQACHKGIHQGFNQAPDMSLPMDSEGGEKIDTMVSLFGALAIDAHRRNLIDDDLYYLSDAVLSTFKQFQEMHPQAVIPGFRIEQAFQIWRLCSISMFNAVLVANDIPLCTRPPLMGSGAIPEDPRTIIESLLDSAVDSCVDGNFAEASFTVGRMHRLLDRRTCRDYLMIRCDLWLRVSRMPSKKKRVIRLSVAKIALLQGSGKIEEAALRVPNLIKIIDEVSEEAIAVRLLLLGIRSAAAEKAVLRDRLPS